MERSSLFERCNHTELYQACRSAGIPALPNEPREKLIAYLEAEEEPPVENANVFDRWRHGIMGFLIEYWPKVEAQLTCPARSKDPLSCFQCEDVQVAVCVTQNKPYEKLIQIHLPRERRS
jgi:hypothetical protein